MENKELFEIALRYIEKDYNTEQLRYGDDLYDATVGEKEVCLNYFREIQEIGIIKAKEHLNTL